MSDDQIEYQIRDKLSFMRFLGLHIEDRVPDAKTVWLFREHLKDHKQGYIAKAGQMIDATFIEIPRQYNSEVMIFSPR